MISKGDFYDYNNGLIYEAMQKLYSLNTPIDILTVREYLNDREQLEKVGWNKYLIELTESIFTSENILQYANIVKSKSIKRNIIKTGNEILQAGYNEEEDTDSILAEVEKIHSSLICESSEWDTQKIDTILYEFQDEVEYAIEFGDKKPWFKTWLPSIDKYTNWFVKGRVMLVSAYANTGKSSLSYFFANSVLRQGAKVLYFSLEIPKDDLRDRLLSNYYWVSIHRFEKKSQMWEFDISEYALKDLYISCDTFNMTEMEIIVKKIKPDVVFIDYVQMVRWDWETEYERMNDIASRMRKMASKQNVAICALSQVANEQKKFVKWGVIPAKWSGELIAAANQVILLRESEFEWRIEAIIAKNRHGKKNKYTLLTPNFETCYFHDWGDEDWGSGKWKSF